ncbi:MAG: hypothetical protein B6229_05490 [Spirochaetaceae bacterium 4572_7]|nr:MAG: hypothetical protein B6229_05490 [Spirochaetaceae bacterium 4572_7]
MKLGSLIDSDFIITGKEFGSVVDAVNSLIELFDKKKILTASTDIVKTKTLDREKLGGTLLPPGIAMPHARVEGVDDLIIGVWVPPKPLETDDGIVKILFFFLTSIAGSSLYLPMLSSIAKSCMDDKFFNKLISSNKDEVHKLLNSVILKQEVTVEDIMTPNPLTCSKDTSLSDLADLFYQKGLSYLPVVDKNMKQIGEVTIKDILNRGVPDYIRRMGSVKFLKNLESFEALLRDEDKIFIKDIMRKPTRSISKDASVIEAVVLITGKGHRHLPVLDHGKLVGLLSETDILKKVIRG